MNPLRTAPERIAELRAVCEYKKKNSQQARDTLDALADITDLTTENERLRAEVAAKDGEIAKAKKWSLELHSDQRALWNALIPARPRCRDCADYDGRCPYDDVPCDPQAEAIENIAKLIARADTAHAAARNAAFREIANIADALANQQGIKSELAAALRARLEDNDGAL